MIHAFQNAFPLDTNVGLLIKTINHHNVINDYHEFQTMISKDARILHINIVMSDIILESLRSAVDCFISLHRAEGYGLNILEHIISGRPVIISAISGSEIFSIPLYAELAPELRIPCTEVFVDREFGPYSKDMKWGQPDIGAAVMAMRLVYSRLGYYTTLALAIRHTALKEMSPASLGAGMRKRLVLIEACLSLVGRRKHLSNMDIHSIFAEAGMPSVAYCVNHVLGKKKKVL